MGEITLTIGSGWNVYEVVDAVNCCEFNDTRTDATPDRAGVWQAICIAWCKYDAGVSISLNLHT